ncbi:iron-containing alcohol dehydrogenase [Selenomonas montiformis]|uniref:iron-containing alcohol dehydrogenase n=1 Tax=Selenomonas montiformis TaxID=2652285 RepID=UPI0039F5C3C1
MEAFEFYIPTKIYFGENCYQKALAKERNLLSKRIFVVTTGRSLYRLGYLPELLNNLKELSGQEALVWDEVSANPKLQEVEAAIAYGRGNRAELIIGFGGGSALDAAKAVAAGIGMGVSAETLLLGNIAPTEKTLPMIAIPTTAGTGSELSRGAIISSPEHGIKKGIRGEHIAPRVAIVDPYFTYQIPYRVTMETGFDVLAHAIESYVSKKATLFSEMISRQCIKMAGRALQDLCVSLEDKKARASISYASMLAGINLANVGNALPHRLQYPVGAATDTSHAAGLLALYPAWLRHEYDYVPEKINRVINLLTGKEVHAKEEAMQAFGGYIARLGVRKSLQELGISPGQEKALAQRVTGNIESDRASKEKDIMEKIYHEAMI